MAVHDTAIFFVSNNQQHLIDHDLYHNQLILIWSLFTLTDLWMIFTQPTSQSASHQPLSLLVPPAAAVTPHFQQHVWISQCFVKVLALRRGNNDQVLENKTGGVIQKTMAGCGANCST